MPKDELLNMAPQLTSIVTSLPSQGTPRNSKRGEVGSLSLVSPTASRFADRARPGAPDSPTHAYRAPDLRTDSRCPCPALNTLANHGYLPRDGKNIHMSTLLDALQHRDTYNLSKELAEVLARGGVLLADFPNSPMSLCDAIFKDGIIPSLHYLSEHGRIEHDASVVHKNVAKGEDFAPIRTDPRLLDDFLGDRQTIELTDVARRRVALETVSALDPLHSEIARGEWALVLGVFGHAHGGKVPAEALREWLSDNRFPDGWRPDHEQSLPETIATSTKIHLAMHDFREMKCPGWTLEDQKLKEMLVSSPQEPNCH